MAEFCLCRIAPLFRNPTRVWTKGSGQPWLKGGYFWLRSRSYRGNNYGAVVAKSLREVKQVEYATGCLLTATLEGGSSAAVEGSQVTRDGTSRHTCRPGGRILLYRCLCRCHAGLAKATELFAATEKLLKKIYPQT